MRILHTSDWHLGQHFMGKTREKEHRAFLAWLKTTVEEQKADALVVAGDVFDTGTPPSYARSLYNEFIVSLQETVCSRVIILGGNHDSAATLNEGKSLLACLKTRVLAGLSDDPEDHVLVVRDRDSRPGLLVCALPYLRPSDLMQSTGGQSGQEKKQMLGLAIEAVYQQIFNAALALQKALGAETGTDLPVMATGHLTVLGTASSESVRDIYIGNLSGFPAAGFPPADYIALGHLHRAQAIDGGACPHIHYAGSPIPLSFDEASQTKQVNLVTFAPGRAAEVTPIPIPKFRSLISLKGSLKTIGQDLAALKAKEDAPDAGTTAWLEVEVAEDDFLSDLTDRVQDLVREKGPEHLELLRVRRRRSGAGPGLVPEAAPRLEELTPGDVFARRLDEEDLDQDRKKAITALFDEIVAQVTAPAPEEDRP